jgi:hypothetical protein
VAQLKQDYPTGVFKIIGTVEESGKDFLNREEASPLSIHLRWPISHLRVAKNNGPSGGEWLGPSWVMPSGDTDGTHDNPPNR